MDYTIAQKLNIELNIGDPRLYYYLGFLFQDSGEGEKALENYRHCIELKKDFSNIADVMKRFHDVEYRNKMVDESYAFVIENHTHRHRIKQITEIVNQRHTLN